MRTGNHFLVAGSDLTSERVRELAKFDLVVLPAEAQAFNPDVSATLHALNPDILLLAYVPTVSYNDTYWNASPVHAPLRDRITPATRLRRPWGEGVSIWPGTSAMNIASREWRDAWVDFAAGTVWASGYWDGIFLDEVGAAISWVGPTDVDGNGIRDDSRVADSAWKNGYTDLFARLRTRVGPRAILITNGSSDSALQPQVNGRMFESFPTPWEGAGRWEDTMRALASTAPRTTDPDVFFLSGNTHNTGVQDLARMRFGLTSALIAGAFFGYDFGTERYGELWYFDEYDVFLGRVVGGAKDMLSPANTTFRPSVWQREFQGGRALVNATNANQRIALGSDFEKLRGAQAPSVNDGRIVQEITLPPQDGLVLLRPVEQLLNSVFPNGAFVRILNADGSRKRNGFFAYTGATVGGEQVAYADVDGNGEQELVSVSARGEVRVHNPRGEVRARWFPYEHYRGGLFLAVGNVVGDAASEIVVAPTSGGGPHVRVFNAEGNLLGEFFAYAPRFTGGVRLAIGNVSGDALEEILTAAGPGGGPHVRAWNAAGVPLGGFFSGATSERGGVQVSAGDMNGDGRAEVLTATGTRPARVRVSDIVGRDNMNAIPISPTPGTRIAAHDVDSDGRAEVLVFTNDVFTLASPH